MQLKNPNESTTATRSTRTPSTPCRVTWEPNLKTAPAPSTSGTTAASRPQMMGASRLLCSVLRLVVRNPQLPSRCPHCHRPHAASSLRLQRQHHCQFRLVAQNRTQGSSRTLAARAPAAAAPSGSRARGTRAAGPRQSRECTPARTSSLSRVRTHIARVCSAHWHHHYSHSLMSCISTDLPTDGDRQVARVAADVQAALAAEPRSVQHREPRVVFQRSRPRLPKAERVVAAILL